MKSFMSAASRRFDAGHASPADGIACFQSTSIPSSEVCLHHPCNAGHQFAGCSAVHLLIVRNRRLVLLIESPSIPPFTGLPLLHECHLFP